MNKGVLSLKDKLIPPIYKILLLFEDVQSNISTIGETDYLKYLDRLYVRYLGYGNEEIYNTIKGLRALGAKADHALVKSTVFHLIELVENEGEV